MPNKVDYDKFTPLQRVGAVGLEPSARNLKPFSEI